MGRFESIIRLSSDLTDLMTSLYSANSVAAVVVVVDLLGLGYFRYLGYFVCLANVLVG